MVMGSFGKEYVRAGKITSENNMWVCQMDPKVRLCTALSPFYYYYNNLA